MFGLQALGFGVGAKNRQKQASQRVKSRARRKLKLEHLERRDAPAALTLVSPGAIFGGAALDGAAKTAVHSLQSSHYGNIARKTSSFGFPSSESHAAMTYSASGYNKSLELRTFAYTTNYNRSTEAIARTTTNNGGGYSYVAVRIDPTSWGEKAGQRVQVTFKLTDVSTIGQANRAYAANTVSFYVNGQQYVKLTDTSKGTETFSRTVTINSTIGATVYIACMSHSQANATPGNMMNNHNVAQNQLNLSMSVRRV